MVTNIASMEQIQDVIVSTMSSICRLPKSALPLDVPLQNLGIDSVIAVEINMEIEGELGVDLPFDEIANGATIRFVSDYLYKKLNSKDEE